MQLLSLCFQHKEQRYTKAMVVLSLSESNFSIIILCDLTISSAHETIVHRHSVTTFRIAPSRSFWYNKRFSYFPKYVMSSEKLPLV